LQYTESIVFSSTSSSTIPTSLPLSGLSASIVLDAAHLDNTFHLLVLDTHTIAAVVDDALLRIPTDEEVPHGERMHHTPQRHFQQASDMSTVAARSERVPKAQVPQSGDGGRSHFLQTKPVP
jgi:hypothetical protein